MDNQLREPLDEFKARELEIINLMATGLSNKNIAEQLFISVETVRWYNKQIYSKLGTSRRTEAIALARQMGLITEGTHRDETATTSPNRLILPETIGPFIGRERDLNEIANLLKNPDVRLVSIIGAGGMGKSRLSLEVGYHIQEKYSQGVVFIDLTAIRNPDDIVPLTVSSLRLTVSGSRDPKDVLLDYCREKEILLIFDNAEHVLSGMRLLGDILKHAPAVKLIATTRERLNLRVETAYFLEPVIEHGQTLFIEVSTLMYPHIAFSDEDSASINEIVELVGGMPLALILAATWVDMLSVPEIVTEIEHSLDFLQSDMADTPERQRSIHAVIEPTWKRLSDSEQKAFMWSSVFRGGFTREVFQEVTGTSIRTLQTLLNRSLINHGRERRYTIHPLIRQYAREKLVAHHMLDDAKNKHLHTVMIYAQTHAERMFRGHYLESLDALEHEADNIRAALEWSLQGNNIEHGVELILANGEFWLARSKSLEAIAYVEKAIQLSEHPMLFYWHSDFLNRLGKVDRAIESAHRLVAYGEAEQNLEWLAYGQIQSGWMTNTKEEATFLFQSALSHAITVGNQHLIATCHTSLALVSANIDVHHHFQQAIDIYETLGDLRGISRVTNNQAIQYYDDSVSKQDNKELKEYSLQRKQEAKELMEYSLQLKQKIGDRAGEARRLTTLSMWSMGEEDFEQAQQWLTQSREICEELGELDRLSYTLTTQGILYLLLTDFEQAQATFERSLQIHIDIKDYRGIVDMYAFLCQLHLLQNNPTDAHQSILKAVEVATKAYSQPTMLIIAYASYLWYMHEQDTCVPIVASLVGQTLNTYSGSTTIVNSYFLQPLTYRIQQHIGDEAWQLAVDKYAEVTLEQIFQDIVDTVMSE